MLLLMKKECQVISGPLKHSVKCIMWANTLENSKPLHPDTSPQQQWHQNWVYKGHHCPQVSSISALTMPAMSQSVEATSLIKCVHYEGKCHIHDVLGYTQAMHNTQWLLSLSLCTCAELSRPKMFHIMLLSRKICD